MIENFSAMVSEFFSAFSTLLQSEPILYLWVILLMFFVIKLIRSLMNINF